MLYVNELKRDRCYQVFLHIQHQLSGMSSTATSVCSLEQSHLHSHPQNIVQDSITREHEHRADQVPQTCWRDAVSVAKFSFIDGISLPSMHGWVNVSWLCLVIVFPDATMHVSSVANPAVGVWSPSKCAPRFVPADRRCKLHRALSFIESWDRCFV